MWRHRVQRAVRRSSALGLPSGDDRVGRCKVCESLRGNVSRWLRAVVPLDVFRKAVILDLAGLCVCGACKEAEELDERLIQKLRPSSRAGSAGGTL